jgi:hypothetical protein
MDFMYLGNSKFLIFYVLDLATNFPKIKQLLENITFGKFFCFSKVLCQKMLIFEF